MTRLYFVDGYNFIIEDPQLSIVLDEEGLSSARRVFRDEVQLFARRVDCRVRIIFDGATDAMSHVDRFDSEHVEISFTSGEEKADERVVAVALEARRRGESPTIVSNDRTGIREPLLAHGFPLITTGEFARRLRETPRSRERRSDALSESEKMELADEFLARDAERRKQKAMAPPPVIPVTYVPKDPGPARARSGLPVSVPRPVAAVVPPARTDLAANREAKKERGVRKQARRLALIQSKKKR